MEKHRDWNMLPLECLKGMLGRVDLKIKITFIVTVLIGFVAHMYMLTNKLPNYDDSYSVFELGSGAWVGRWFLEYIRGISLRLQGNFSMPWLNGLLAILLIAASACIICVILEIKDQLNQILIGGLMISFPAVTALFTFMFTAPVYGLAIFLAACAAYLTTRYRWGGIPGSILMAFSLGIYQAYWGIAATTLLLALIIHCLDDRKNYRAVIVEAFRYLLTLAFSLVVYLTITKFLLRRWGASLGEYQGLNQMGTLDIKRVPANIARAYNKFFSLCKEPLWSVNDDRIIRWIFTGVFILTLILIIIVFIRRRHKKFIMLNVGLLLFLILFPLSVNIVYLMVGDPRRVYIYTIMVYPVVFSVILLIVLIDKMPCKKENIWNIGIIWCATLLLTGLIISWVQVSNRTYLAMELRHQSVKAYFTTLITQTKQTDKYKAEYPVAFIGEIDDSSLPSFADFGGARIMGVANADPVSFVNNYENSRIRFLKYYCGYQFKAAVNVEEIKESKEFSEMKVYPETGSIKVIKETVVVKFSE